MFSVDSNNAPYVVFLSRKAATRCKEEGAEICTSHDSDDEFIPGEKLFDLTQQDVDTYRKVCRVFADVRSARSAIPKAHVGLKVTWRPTTRVEIFGVPLAGSSPGSVSRCLVTTASPLPSVFG